MQTRRRGAPDLSVPTPDTADKWAPAPGAAGEAPPLKKVCRELDMAEAEAEAEAMSNGGVGLLDAAEWEEFWNACDENDVDDEPSAPDPVAQAAYHKMLKRRANCMACKECQPNQMAHYGGCMPDPDMPDSDDEDENVCPTAEE